MNNIVTISLIPTIVLLTVIIVALCYEYPSVNRMKDDMPEISKAGIIILLIWSFGFIYGKY